MRKRFLGLLLTAAMVACTMPMTAMAADGDSQDFKDENLVVGVWGGTIEEVLRKNVVDPMEEEYGCNIDLVLGGTIFMNQHRRLQMVLHRMWIHL